jgi:hypothetical protein
MSDHDYNKPFVSNSPTDHRAGIWIATLLCLAIAALGVATRVWTRWKVFGSDDYVIVGAFAVAVIEFIIVIVGLHNGLGQSTTESAGSTVALAGQVCIFFQKASA